MSHKAFKVTDLDREIRFAKVCSWFSSEPEIIDVVGAARFLCVSRWSIYDWVQQGVLLPRRHGGRLAFSLDYLRKWSESRQDRPLQQRLSNRRRANNRTSKDGPDRGGGQSS